MFYLILLVYKQQCMVLARRPLALETYPTTSTRPTAAACSIFGSIPRSQVQVIKPGTELTCRCDRMTVQEAVAATERKRMHKCNTLQKGYENFACLLFVSYRNSYMPLHVIASNREILFIFHWWCLLGPEVNVHDGLLKCH